VFRISSLLKTNEPLPNAAEAYGTACAIYEQNGNICSGKSASTYSLASVSFVARLFFCIYFLRDVFRVRTYVRAIITRRVVKNNDDGLKFQRLITKKNSSESVSTNFETRCSCVGKKYIFDRVEIRAPAAIRGKVLVDKTHGIVKYRFSPET